MASPQPHPLDRRVVGVFGATGSGKTQCARALVRMGAFPPRVLWLDPGADTREGIDVEKVAHTRSRVLEYLSGVKPHERFSVAYRPPVEDPESEAAAFLARLAMALGTCVLVIDEAHRACNQTECDADVHVVALRGRHRGVSLILVSQRPTHVHTDLRAEAYGCETYFFRLARKKDLDDVALERGREFSEEVARLPNLRGYRVTPGGTLPVRVILRARPRPPTLRYEGLD